MYYVCCMISYVLLGMWDRGHDICDMMFGDISNMMCGIQADDMRSAGQWEKVVQKT